MSDAGRLNARSAADMPGNPPPRVTEPHGLRESGARAPGARHETLRRGFAALHRSPLARKIIGTNILALVLLTFVGALFSPTRDHLLFQREANLVSMARLVANVLEVQSVALRDTTLTRPDVRRALSLLDLAPSITVRVFDTRGMMLGTFTGSTPYLSESSVLPDLDRTSHPSPIRQVFERMGDGLSNQTPRIFAVSPVVDGDALARRVFAKVTDQPATVLSRNAQGRDLLSVGTPVWDGDRRLGVVTLTGSTGLVDLLMHERLLFILKAFLIVAAVSVAMSLALAATIAKPLADLASAADLEKEWRSREYLPVGMRLSDISDRPDEIGRLSQAMRGMVSALYSRIESNEQFAADVAHEIKNPLASLRSAVGTMRVARRDDQRETLLTVIEHDVRRLDRLVSDISNASRLDSDLVKEQEQRFDLLRMLGALIEHMSRDAAARGIAVIADLPAESLVIEGLEERLAQVFVNLIANALSFCEEGDAVRIWARRRENRVLVVVEDTGPGIPDQALALIFNRFYSERPPDDFGNHSGLGLAISKQIVEAHGGVIWAENIRPTDADVTSDPLGARFVVGLPV